MSVARERKAVSMLILHLAEVSKNLIPCSLAICQLTKCYEEISLKYFIFSALVL